MSNFWELASESRHPAVVEVGSGQALTYDELARAADAQVNQLELREPRQLVFIFARNDLASLTAYLGCLRRGHVAALLPVGRPGEALLTSYLPDRLIAPPDAPSVPGYEPIAPGKWRRLGRSAGSPPHEDLALLLSTSGSTGSPKMVRLSRANLQANAVAIAGYLGLTPNERAPTTLPLSYSYGLSVVHSHLAAGATLLLGDFPVVQASTWQILAEHGATSFAGVPLVYQMLRRLRFEPRSVPTLRTFTQAGGRLDSETKAWFLERATSGGARFFVMYGQTEATARISFVPPERLPEKLDSIGRTIPGGELSVDPDGGELIYRGPNVMLGYASSREELALADTQRGVLRTGDLGRVDPDGFFYVEGRLKRFLKLAGLRISLDEIERHLERSLDCAVACGGQDESLVIQLEKAVTVTRVHAMLQQDFGLAPSLVQVRSGAPIARLATGKIDYAALAP
jgi:long-chain acyl-CoA synthetase